MDLIANSGGANAVPYSVASNLRRKDHACRVNDSNVGELLMKDEGGNLYDGVGSGIELCDLGVVARLLFVASIAVVIVSSIK